MEGAVFEESEGPIEDILGGRKDKMLYTILRVRGKGVSLNLRFTGFYSKYYLF